MTDEEKAVIEAALHWRENIMRPQDRTSPVEVALIHAVDAYRRPHDPMLATLIDRHSACGSGSWRITVMGEFRTRYPYTSGHDRMVAYASALGWVYRHGFQPYTLIPPKE